jgi:hypothetical protein
MNFKNQALILLISIFIQSCSNLNVDQRNPASEKDCAALVESFVNSKPKSFISTNTSFKLRYPNGYEGQKGTQIQYGFESEYTLEESEILLKQFMPDEDIYSGTEKDWLKLTHKERVEFLEENEAAIFPYRAPGKLKKITKNKALSDSLPESFVYDSGRFEIVLSPSDSLEDIASKIKTINKNVGIGSMQVTISAPFKDGKKLELSERRKIKEEMLGFYNFINDYDTISKLSSGYKKYLTNPELQATKSFNHPWLGPMNKLKHKRLEKLVDRIIDGDTLNEQELKEVSFLVVSHKFIGGLAFRPDVAYSKHRLASEARDCHQNPKCISDRLKRQTYFLMKGFSNFRPYSDLRPFDSEFAFDFSIPRDVREVLKEIFPPYSNFKNKELELFRNFSYPFRDWSVHIRLLGNPKLSEQIKLAQKSYLEQLKKISESYSNREINVEQAHLQIEGALAKFSDESGLSKSMSKKYQEFYNEEDPEVKALDTFEL